MIGAELTVLENLVGSFATIIPNVIGALFLLVLGWLVGRVAYMVMYKVLRKFKIDAYFKLEKPWRFSETFSVIIKWIIYLAFIQAALDVLGVWTLSQHFEQVIALITGMMGGIIVLLVAYLIGRYVQKRLEVSKGKHSQLMSQLIFLFIMVLAVSMAFEVANIPNDLINTIIVIAVASVGLGVAIALGLGLKDTVSRVAKKYEKKL